MVKDGEDWHGLQSRNLKSLAKLFKPFTCNDCNDDDGNRKRANLVPRVFVPYCAWLVKGNEYPGYEGGNVTFLNLVPSVSLLCLPWSLEERPWLRLVTWPPRIWVAKKSVGWEGWQSTLFGSCEKLCGFQILKQSLKTTRSFGVRVEFADDECYMISAVFKI